MIEVTGGVRGTWAMLRREPMLLGLGMAGAAPLATMTVAWATGRDAGLLPDLLWCGGLAVMAWMALRGRWTGDGTGAVGARATLAKLVRRVGRGGTPLLKVWVDGMNVASACVLAPEDITRPGASERELRCGIHVIVLGDDMSCVSADGIVGFDEDGIARVDVGIAGRIRTYELDAGRVMEIHLEKGEWRDRTKHPGTGTDRAAEFLSGMDTSTRDGVTRARRSAAKRLHPDVAGGGDPGLLAEVNDALDLREARIAS